jgi:enamine deaminase RidA (YjgF/YER057c/UK114 family)
VLNRCLPTWKTGRHDLGRHSLRRHDLRLRVSAVRGTVIAAAIERQTELVLEQIKLYLETAGSSLEGVLKFNVHCTSAEKFAAVNAIYTCYFPTNPPAQTFVCVP